MKSIERRQMGYKLMRWKKGLNIIGMLGPVIIMAVHCGQEHGPLQPRVPPQVHHLHIHRNLQ